MAVRREDPNYPDIQPSPLVEALLGILEDADVDEATNDAISLVVETAESQVAGERPVYNARLAAALQSLRTRTGPPVADLRDALLDARRWILDFRGNKTVEEMCEVYVMRKIDRILETIDGR